MKEAYAEKVWRLELGEARQSALILALLANGEGYRNGGKRKEEEEEKEEEGKEGKDEEEEEVEEKEGED